MGTFFQFRLRIFIILATFLIPFTSVKAVEVIVHPSVDTQHLSSSQIRRIFTMRNKQWNNAQPIKVFVLANSSNTHKEFCIQKLEVFPYQLDKIWGKLLFSGLGEPPMVVNNVEQMIELVAKTPGSIGYVDKLPKDSGVKVMVVGNKDE
ncbi:hypothetical protein AAD001_10070 [Colwelliaceae bacterium 6471]